MIIHLYSSLVPNSGDIRRIKNIDKEFTDYFNVPSLEVTFYGWGDRPTIKRCGKFKVGGENNKKLYIMRPPKARVIFPTYEAIVLALLCLIYKPKVFVGEMYLPYMLKRLLRVFSPKTKVFADIHGAVVEEISYLHPNTDAALLKSYSALEKHTMNDADHIVCQSDEMKKYIIDKYSIDCNNIIVYRCGYDTGAFNINSTSRIEIRRELGVSDDEILFVYSGGLHGWQKVEESLIVFRDYHLHNPKSKMLVLTGDQEALSSMLEKTEFEKVRNMIMSFSVPFTSVSKYLNASDIAFLLRDDHVMNAVASPTKLAEYFACGLPIITSTVARHWVTDEACEFLVFSEEGDINKSIDNLLSDIDKCSIERYAREHLSLAIDKGNIRKSLDLLLK